jgi:hypothetical protein
MTLTSRNLTAGIFRNNTIRSTWPQSRSEDRKIQQDRLEACLCKPDMLHRWELKVYKDGRPLCVRDRAGAMTGLASHASVPVICENIFEAHLLP